MAGGGEGSFTTLECKEMVLREHHIITSYQGIFLFNHSLSRFANVVLRKARQFRDTKKLIEKTHSWLSEIRWKFVTPDMDGCGS